MSLNNPKGLHQRNKSSPALGVMAQNNVSRRTFGEVKNSKEMNRISRDDSSVGGKPVAVNESKTGLAHPAQRPMSSSNTRTVVDKVANAKPMNPAGKAQPTSKATKRTNTVFKDQLQPVPETDSSKETQTNIEGTTGLKEAEKMAKPTTIAVVASKGAAGSVAHLESDATISEPEEVKEKTSVKELVLAVSEPEEWDEDETEYAVAPTDATTTTDLFPRMNSVTQGQMFQAKRIVESDQTDEDREEDLLDTTMVAEYNDEIFLHLRKKEVSSVPSLLALIVELTHYAD